MPVPETADQFLRELSNLHCVDEARLGEWATGAATDSAAALADRLVSAGLLSRYQADCVLAGRGASLRIAHYTVLRPAQADGRGQTFVCVDDQRCPVLLQALPRSKQQDPELLARFREEAEAAARLTHPNLPRVFPIAQQGETSYLPTEHVGGTSLQALVQRDGPLALGTAVDYLHQAALGLGHAHAAGVAHRDLRPQNLLVGAAGTIKVVDMGIGRFFHDDEDILTRKYDETILGTADYLAPE